MKAVQEILARNGLNAPDGRQLHAYEATDDEVERLRRDLQFRVSSGVVVDSTSIGFTLWASERIRAGFSGGQLSWDFVFDGLGLQYVRALAIGLTERGLELWRRPLRRSGTGDREFLYSLLAEGGLPDLALAHAPRYRQVLLGLIGEIEAEGSLGGAVAELAALRAVEDLPQVFHSAETARLLAALAQSLVALRSALPDALPGGAAEAWLDVHIAGWRQELPLRLSPVALDVLVRPALAAERAKPRRDTVVVQRQLRRRADGAGWAGAAEIAAEALLRPELLPGVDLALRLRLTAESGASFLAVPEPGEGWRLRPGGVGRRETLLALSPAAAVELLAHADGRTLGEVVLDPGQPEPTEAASLWRPREPGDGQPEVLIPLSGQGKTRSAQAFLLADSLAQPEASSGVRIGLPESGPEGRVWPLSGQGSISVGEQTFALATGSEDEEPTRRMLALGPILPGFTQAGRGPVWLGRPLIRGAIGESRLMELGRHLSLRPLARVLGGQVAEWREGTGVVAQLRLVTLPGSLRLSLRESAPGEARLEAEGLGPGWHLALSAGPERAHAKADPSGRAALVLKQDGLPGMVSLRLSDPTTGAALELSSAWPARSGMLIDPNGQRLEANRLVALSGLEGWRGVLPEGRGAIQVRPVRGWTPVGFPATGTVRLAALRPLLAQVQALGGADGRVNLRLVAGSAETPRLEVGRYDWTSEEAGPFRHLGAGRVALTAVCLDDPSRAMSAEAEGRIDLAGWLCGTETDASDNVVWFVQGVSVTRGVMRPFVWSARPRPPSTRSIRLAGYEAEWRRLLSEPGNPGWDRAWALIQAVRQRGDAEALDQVQALAQVPAAAAVIVLRARSAERAEALSLETEAPIWWPSVRCEDWERAMGFVGADLAARLAAAGVSGEENATEVLRGLQRAAGDTYALRPELTAHLGQALGRNGLPALAQDARGKLVPLAVPNPRARLGSLAQEAARRFDALPHGVARVRAAHLSLPVELGEGMEPLLHAPLVVAEVAAALRPALSPDKALQLIALRWADPLWFDAALPVALSLALETQS